MAVIVLHEGPKNLVVLVNSGGGTLNVSALNPPCVGLQLLKAQPTADAVGSVAGPTNTVWSLAAGNRSTCFDDFGGISDGNGNWTLTVSAGIAILTFWKIRPTHPNPN